MSRAPGFVHDLIVIGASLDGPSALAALVARLPEDLPSAVCVVQHSASDSPGMFAQMLDKAGPLPASQAEHGAPLEDGRIYVAPPDQHLMVRDGHMVVRRGPRENRVRPAIDPLFRTAAAAYRSRVIGVVLTGLLDDGAAGLRAIKRCGGLAVVQAPEDAAHPAMPRAALDAVEADHVAPVAELGALLGRLARTPAPPPPPVPEDLQLEVRLTERVMNLDDAAEGAQHFGTPVLDMCPECGGPMRMLPGERPARFRCYLGHAYTVQTLLAEQGNAVERALWAALRQLEERLRLLTRMTGEERTKGRQRIAADFEQRAAEVEEHVQSLRGLLQQIR